MIESWGVSKDVLGERMIVLIFVVREGRGRKNNYLSPLLATHANPTLHLKWQTCAWNKVIIIILLQAFAITKIPTLQANAYYFGIYCCFFYLNVCFAFGDSSHSGNTSLTSLSEIFTKLTVELTLPRVCRGDSPLKTLLYQCKSCLKIIYSTLQSNYFDLIGPKNTSHEVVVNYCLFCFVHSHLSKQLLMFSDVV